MKILLTSFITSRRLVNKIRKMWQLCSLPAIRLHDSIRMVKLMDLSGSFWFQKRDKTEFHQAMVKTSKSAGLKEKSTYFTTDLRIQHLRIQHGATWCNMMQHGATWCNMVQHGARCRLCRICRIRPISSLEFTVSSKK